MKVTLSRKAHKQYDRLNEPIRSRVRTALDCLSKEPPQGDIKSLEGRDGYRVRVGGHRIIFDRIHDTIVVYGIEPRGGAYKRR
ncbi:MAG: type II toxin-antitoxin system RelE/ParE family toxin [Coriobacteriales bacterium]|nr:type II toxin-antitoxin system RelE/ParE family toxin [Coriobacteriales bacterium]